MKRYIHYIFFLVLSSWLLALNSCTPDTECRQDENVRCKVVFGDAGEDYNLVFDSLTVQGVGSNSILYNNAKNVSSLSLPLRPDTNITQFIITVDGYYPVDTLTIYHTPAPYFVSMACGCFVYHTIDSVKTYGPIFWKGEIINTSVQNIEEENIVLYIRIPEPESN